ncbi:MAG: cobyrinate a,c-diamide synthase [Deltaproteobacteria bacterium]|nr:cobyrinate a,c-diamide synthase [Deltaproteobacteria bacterium]
MPHDLFCPRLIIAALRGGGGKTTLTLGLIRALRNRGLDIVPFKKGPDYIDAGWLAMAGGRPCHNLDPFLMSWEVILDSFARRVRAADGAVIEGNRGLYDGVDAHGAYSTAELAKTLKAPVALVVDCVKTTRTAAAMVLGCLNLDPQVELKAVLLNQVLKGRHESVLRSAIETYTGVPVLGAIPKLPQNSFPERHMGLVPCHEHPQVVSSLEKMGQVVASHVDLDRLWSLASSAPPLRQAPSVSRPEVDSGTPPPVIGVFRDTAFQFYYPENIEALSQLGAKVLDISPLCEEILPPVDALYIGGGFPETHAAILAQNRSFRASVVAAVESGLPVYAECGGLMYLGRSLLIDGQTYPMAGVLPLIFGLEKKPQGHGYAVVEVDGDNPYFETGSCLKGHEFHYSHVLEWPAQTVLTVFRLKKGHGLGDKRDGICYKNVLATYVHLHALGTPSWAVGLVAAARRRKALVESDRRHEHEA